MEWLEKRMLWDDHGVGSEGKNFFCGTRRKHLMPRSKAKTSPEKLPKKSKTYSLEDFLKISKKGQVWQVGESRFRIQKKGTFQKQPKGGEVTDGKDYDLDFFQKDLVSPFLLKTGKSTKKAFQSKNKKRKFQFVRSEKITVAFPGKRSPSAYHLFVQDQTKKRYNKFSREKTDYNDGGLSTKQQNIRAWQRQLASEWGGGIDINTKDGPAKRKDYIKNNHAKYILLAQEKQSQCNDGFVLTKVNVPKGIRKNVTKRKKNETEEEKEARAKQNRIWKRTLMNNIEVVYVLDDQGKPVKQGQKDKKEYVTKAKLSREGKGSWGENNEEKTRKRRVVLSSRQKAGRKNYKRRKDIHNIWTGESSKKAKRDTIRKKYGKYILKYILKYIIKQKVREKQIKGASDKQIVAELKKYNPTEIDEAIKKISEGFAQFRSKNWKNKVKKDMTAYRTTKSRRFCNPDKTYENDECPEVSVLAGGRDSNDIYASEALDNFTQSEMAILAKKPEELHGNIFAMVHPDEKNKYFVVVGSTEMSDKYGVDERTKTYLNVMDYNPETGFMGKEVYLFPTEPSEVGSKKMVPLQGGKNTTGLRVFPTKRGSKVVLLTANDDSARLDKLQVREDRKMCVKCPKHTTAETSNRYPNGYCEPDDGYKWIGNPFPGRGQLVKIEGKKKMNKKKKMSKREKKKEKEKEKEDDIASQNSDLSSAAEESEEVRKVKPKFITGTQLLEVGKIGDKYKDEDGDVFKIQKKQTPPRLKIPALRVRYTTDYKDTTIYFINPEGDEHEDKFQQKLKKEEEVHKTTAKFTLVGKKKKSTK
jgi:hypothetical protein